MVENMYSFVKAKIKSFIDAASFFAMTVEETTSVDNTSWIAIYYYIMKAWERILLLIQIQKLERDGATLDNLKVELTSALEVLCRVSPC